MTEYIQELQAEIIQNKKDTLDLFVRMNRLLIIIDGLTERVSYLETNKRRKK